MCINFRVGVSRLHHTQGLAGILFIDSERMGSKTDLSGIWTQNGKTSEMPLSTSDEVSLVMKVLSARRLHNIPFYFLIFLSNIHFYNDNISFKFSTRPAISGIEASRLHWPQCSSSTCFIDLSRTKCCGTFPPAC